jgi:eukaryotic-like serine/threonine-protein kinase
MTPSEATERLVGDRYVLETPLGRGGMGVVWRAHDTLLKRYVAVKEVQVPRTMPGTERSSLERRVLREARAAGALSHPSVVAVYDVTEDEGRSFIVMELVDAPTLEQLVRSDGPLDPRRAAEIGLDVLGALEMAHSNGIVHRDVKPANVMVPSAGSAKLADFGIATVTGDPKLTASGIILGSPSYMAPEQVTDTVATSATDIWALGAVLFFAVMGRPPFDKGQPIPTLTAVLNEEPDVDPESTGNLTPAITAALQKDPSDRPSTQEMRSLLELEPSPKPPLGTVQRVDVPAPVGSKRRAAWPLVAIVAVIGAVLAGILLLGTDNEDGSDTSPGSKAEQQRGQDEGSRVPDSFTTYTDDEIGYRVAYPEGWSVSDPGVSNATDLRDEATGTYLRVDWVTPPNGTPEGAWREQAESSRFDTIAITPTTFRGMDAALWEYTYSDGGAALHAYNLGFITRGDTYGMALNFQTHEENWDSSQELWEQLKAGFEVPN